MDFETMEVDRMLEYAEVAGVARSVLTSPRYEADGCPDRSHLSKAIGMLVVEAGIHIHSVGVHDCYSHWRRQEVRVVT